MSETVYFILRGAYHRGREVMEHLRTLSPGHEFNLIAEPTNPNDSNAIMVFDSDLHIGYVAKEIAADLFFYRIKDAKAVMLNNDNATNPMLELQYLSEEELGETVNHPQDNSAA